MYLFNVLLPFLALNNIISVSQSDDNCDAQHELMEQFLMVRNLETAILYTCWSLSGNA